MEQEPSTTLLKMKSGIAHIGDVQFLPGYCVLFADPQVASLNDLTLHQRTDFLLDMGLLGDAILSVCNPVRINYGILGNSHPHLHAHLFPRYDWEPAELRKRNVWRYPEEYWNKEYAFDPAKHGDMRNRLIETLRDLMAQAYS